MDIISYESAYHWLNIYDGSHLAESNEHLVRVLNVSLGDNKTKEAWHVIGRLKTNSEHITDEMEVGEIYTACGRAAYKLGDSPVSAAYFEDAILRYGWRTHHAAVVGWLLGYSYWDISGKKRDTFKVWGDSIRMFEELSHRSVLAQESLAWYGVRVEEMKSTLLCYQDEDCGPGKRASG